MAPKKSSEEVNEVELDPVELEIQQLRLAAAKAEAEAAKINLERAKNAPAADSADEELRTVQLQTARLQMLREKEANDKWLAEREALVQKRKQAVETMRQEEAIKKNAAAMCKHRVGGYKGDTYKGGHGEPSSIICMNLPIMGRKLLMCTRCFDEIITPDPNLLRGSEEDKARYEAEMVKYREFEEMFDNSYQAIPMGGPQFTWTNDEGLPVHPRII